MNPCFRLVGPGGAGKTTVGLALANRIGIRFLDLDEEFTVRHGDISSYLAAHGYGAYAHQNVQIYLDTLAAIGDSAVFALSSGFMTYAEEVHGDYRRARRAIAESPTTAVLLPSFDLDTCVAETVRRQLMRPFSRTAQREEQVIRARFDVYRQLPTKQFETIGAIGAVVERVARSLDGLIRRQSTSSKQRIERARRVGAGAR